MPHTDTTPTVTIVPANEASCEDLQAVFGTRGDAFRCQCPRFKTPGRRWDLEFASGPVEERARLLREQTGCGQPGACTTSGLVDQAGAAVDGHTLTISESQRRVAGRDHSRKAVFASNE